MGKTAIVYASTHHANTKKLVEYIAAALETEPIDITKTARPDVRACDTLIVASGIYFHNIHRRLTEFLQAAPLQGKRAILVYTCGVRYAGYARAVRALLRKRGALYLGAASFRGYDTFGVFAKIGGIAKGHPTQADLRRVLKRVERMLAAEAAAFGAGAPTGEGDAQP